MGAPEVVKLDAFAKKQKINARLGMDFWCEISHMQLHATKPCPRVRSAMVACNLTSPKVSDGISKLITVTDMQSLKTKNKINGLWVRILKK